MLGSYGLVAFVLTRDATRAKAFYGATLGLTFVSEDDFAVVFDANGTQLRVTKMPEHTPSDHTVIGWEVPDIAHAAGELARGGITFEKYEFLEQDDLGIWTAPGSAAKVAWFKDPDGNVLSITEHSSGA